MSDTLTLKSLLRLTGTYVADQDLSDPSLSVAINDSQSFTTGTGAGQANVYFQDQRVLNASASEDLDLAGSLKDAFGRTITFTAIKGIYVKAAAGNTNNVEVGGAAATQFAAMFGDVSDKVVVKPGGVFFIMDPGATGYAVTAGSADLLKIANSGGTTTVTYDIVIFGEGTLA